MRKQFEGSYDDIISLENLLAAWVEFLKGKRNKKDVQEFGFYLMENILALHRDLFHHTYKHGSYQAFNISDPKPRNIHKAAVRDRLLHHAIYRMLYPFFDQTFISDSYSCRKNKGTHKAINRFHAFAFKAGQNNTQTVWVLKCDIKKFFANISHSKLMSILRKYISDKKLLWLLNEIVQSFHLNREGVGLPLGNLTSQLLVNIYLNEFDQFVKHRLKARYYIRYADDFVILSGSRPWLQELLPRIRNFFSGELGLELHLNKVEIRTLASGVDFLGWKHFTDHRILRKTTRKRMIRRIRNGRTETLSSYLGLLEHGNSSKLRQAVTKLFFLARAGA